MSEWQSYRIADLGQVVTGRTPASNKPELLGSGTAFVTPTDISEQSIYAEPQRRLSSMGDAEFRRIILPPEAVCFTCIASIGKMCLTKEPTLTNQQINSLIVDHYRAVPRWTFYALKAMREEITAIASGSATPIINKTSFGNIRLLVPPLPTQRRISSVLGAYDDLIEVNRRRIAVLKKMARGLFEEWFVRFRFPGHEAVPILDTPDGLLPEGWALDTLGALADIQWGDTSITKKSYTTNGFRTYSASGPDGFRSKFDHERVGVVLSAIGAQCGKIWLARGKWSCIKNTMRFWAHAEGVCTEYLYLALSDPEKWPKRGAAQPFISLGDARKIKIIRPERNTTIRFAASVAPMLELADALLLQNEHLATSRDLLLPRLISGQLSVAKAARELEEVT